MAGKKVKTIQVNMHEAKTRLSQLAELAWQGQEIVIARAGKPYLDLKPHTGSGVPRKPGRFKGQIEIAEDFNATPEEVLRSFEGES